MSGRGVVAGVYDGAIVVEFVLQQCGPLLVGVVFGVYAVQERTVFEIGFESVFGRGACD